MSGLQTKHPRPVAESILFSADILQVIVENLTLPEALRVRALAATSKENTARR